VKVTFFGDSLTAGYGLGRDEAFPARIREYAAREGVVVDVVNAGASGDTTAGGLRRLEWVTRERPDLFVLALGANDGLRGLDTESMKANLSEIVRRIRGKFPAVPILLLPMELPPTLGQEYVQRFRDVYSQVARETAIVLGPFLLEQVAGRQEFNLPDGLHPNARGHELVAQTVWPSIRSILGTERKL
jgi:acyl-CoA thioesterase-1